MTPARLGIVTPWFGPELRGGAEQQSFQLAKNLAARGYLVDVLTTCSASFSGDWSKNAFRPGVEKRGNLSVYRFRTRKRDRRAFERVNAILTELPPERLWPCVSPIGDDDASVFYEENINSPALLAHLSERGAGYHSIIFLPYLYGTTLSGLPLVRERAFLQPCLHDEPYAYLQRVQENVVAARGLLLNSAGELELAVRLYGPGIMKKSAIVGEGVLTELPEKQPHHVGAFVPSERAYVLYLGRQDETKNVGMLLKAWADFKRRRPTSRLQLVLAGQHSGSSSDKLRGIADLGPVTGPEKNALLAHCAALVQPSVNESFSRVLYEAWLHGRPVVVHGECLATATAVATCNGGVLATTVPEWEAALQWIDEATPAQLREPGERGRAFARDYASWDAVIARYERVLGLAAGTAVVPPPQPVANGQSLPNERRAPRVDPRDWDILPDRPLAEALHDGKQNLLYVGALVARQHLDQLVITFLNYLTLEREARLTIVGTGDVDDALYRRLLGEVYRLDIADHVLVARNVSPEQFVAVFRAADILITLDTAESPGEPFMQALWFDVPILAYRTATAQALVGEAALLVTDTSDLLAIAALAQLLVVDPALRRTVLHGQRQLRSKYDSDSARAEVTACTDVPA